MGKRILAFDYGASSGRAMLSTLENGKIEIEEVHRFSNDPVMMRDTLYWDVLRLFFEMRQGIVKAQHAGGFDSIGVDTWGVDFGLLDKEGRLLENPVHYRDVRYEGYLEKVFEKISSQRLYEITGIQNMDINTICQLYYLVEHRQDLLERAETLLFMPDLLRYMLSGEKNTEYTIASTSQLLDAKKRDWSWEIIDALGIPRRLFTPIIQLGTVVGKLSKSIAEELGVPQVDIVAVPEHDTASAVLAVPAKEEDFIYISCGTWSLFGTELKEPNLTQKAADYNITNEGGINDTIRFLKNISGLWLIQEARRQWIREGDTYSYAELEEKALAVEPFRSFIDPDDPRFTPPGDQPARVRDFCRETGQPVPETVGEVMRCIYESLALKYRHTLEMIRDVTQQDYAQIHIVGGGTKDNLLCQMTANSCDKKVLAGPIEATVLGNISSQMIALEMIDGVQEAREIISHHDIVTYTPVQVSQWEQAYQRYQEFIVE